MTGGPTIPTVRPRLVVVVPAPTPGTPPPGLVVLVTPPGTVDPGPGAAVVGVGSDVAHVGFVK